MTLTLEPEARPMPPQRRRVQLRQVIAEARTHAQQARQYAEAWYQALRRWEVEYAKVPVSAVSYGAFRPQSAPSDIEMIGSALPSLPSYLNLPSGQYRETEVGQIISAMMQSGAFETAENGHLLDTLRDSGQRKPESLLRADGRWVRQTSSAWALAVLALGVQLRDEQSEFYIGYCRREFERASKTEAD